LCCCPVLLVDLRRLQSQAAGAEPGQLRQLLAGAPAWSLAADQPVLLCGDPHWAASPAAPVLLDWLGTRPRHFCFNPEFGDACLAALQAVYDLQEVCVPSLEAPHWHRQPLHPAGMAPGSASASDGRPRLAYLSPMPPQRTGISDYSVALLPHLAEHFAIDLVSERPWQGPLPAGVGAVLKPEQFAEEAHRFDHILYHVGNSSAHLEMIGLLQAHPGAVVLHDFFLAHGLLAPEADDWLGGTSTRRLYISHGYQAVLVQAAAQRHGHDQHVWTFPCNLPLLQQADGVIVHSRESLRLAEQFYGEGAAQDWTVIPHLKEVSVPAPAERAAARARLGFSDDALVICSFGFLGRAKCSTLLLQAFLESGLAGDPRCSLVFAGSPGGDQDLRQQLRRAAERARHAGTLQAEVRFTGWIDAADYRAYLACADMAVQLRRSSRGETSGTVLDCLGAGVPLIVNAHGTLGEIPEGCALRLPDGCEADDVRRGLETLATDPELRRALVARGLSEIAERHRPAACAARYAEALRAAGERARRRRRSLAPFRELVAADPRRASQAANTLRLLFPPRPRLRQLLLDVSAMAEQDLGSGVQRVVRSIAQQLLMRPPVGFRVEPVAACADGLGYRYARRYTTAFLQAAIGELEDGPIAFDPGDVFLGIDLSHDVVRRQKGFYSLLRAQGVEVHFVVHDLLPCTLPECFPPGTAERHRAWLDVVLQGDGALCVSRSVMEELRGWLPGGEDGAAPRRFRLGWFHHGADFRGGPCGASSAEHRAGLQPLAGAPTLLMVGTVEPRKGYLEVLQAASALWRSGAVFNLVIVGREGWTDLPTAERRTIPATVAAIRRHPQLNRRLFWFDAASDAQLEGLYQRADGLIAASLGEGFGIPLIEAAAFGLPLLLRDLPVFREVSAGAAWFFPGDASTEQLRDAIAGFLGAIADGSATAAAAAAPRPTPQTWSQSADQLVRALGLQPGVEAVPWGVASTPGQEEVRPGRRRRWRRRLGRIKSRLKRLLRVVRGPQPLLPPPLQAGEPPEALLPGAELWRQELGRRP
jgi:glycosyltransferase involved in cell wall biosynthesis